MYPLNGFQQLFFMQRLPLLSVVCFDCCAAWMPKELSQSLFIFSIALSVQQILQILKTFQLYSYVHLLPIPASILFRFTEGAASYPSYCDARGGADRAGQYIRGPHRDKWDKQPCTLTLAPPVNLESPFSLKACFGLWEEAGTQREKHANTGRIYKLHTVGIWTRRLLAVATAIIAANQWTNLPKMMKLSNSLLYTEKLPQSKYMITWWLEIVQMAYLFVSVWPCDGLAAYPGCTIPLIRWQLTWTPVILN